MDIEKMIKSYNGTEKGQTRCENEEVEGFSGKYPVISRRPDIYGFRPYEYLGPGRRRKIEKALLEAFSMDAFQAYNAFRTRVWLNVLLVDVFLADLVKLVHLAELTDENLIKRAFVVGLPGQVSRTLQATAVSKI